MTTQLPSYVLITPARNEGDYIGRTIESITAQTVPPRRWVIVSDGSTDRTDDIAGAAAQKYDWIELVRLPPRTERNFAAKVLAFEAGRERVGDLDYEIIGNVDADTSFEPDYFEFLLRCFAANPQLGVAGTPVIESGAIYDFRFASDQHVSGPCQLFRRSCFEAIGGYQPIKRGAIDWVAVTTARMRGWETRSFLEKTYLHHRPMGTAGSGVLTARFRYGQKNFYTGNHPLWQVMRSCHQMSRKPYVIGGMLLFSGYLWGWLSRMERPIPPELIRFHRGEQMRRLRGLLRRSTAPQRRQRSGQPSPTGELQ